MNNTPFRYINGSMAFPPPFQETGSHFNNFVYTVDPKKLQKVCDQWFNIPSNGEVYYQPLLPVVLVTFGDCQSARPDVGPYKDWGFIKYREVIFSIFTVRLIKKGGIWLADHVGALVPYIFVDDSIVMAAGREVYGMPKIMSTIQIPENIHEGSPKFSLASVSTQQFDPNIAFQNLPIASIEQEKSNDATPHRWADMKTAFEEIKHLIFGGNHITLPDFDLLIEMGKVFLEQKLPFSSLRQLRNIDSSDTAAYQAIVDFYARMTKFESAGLLPGNYRLNLPDNKLFPIAEDLGLQDGQLADAAFWLKWNFIFETGTNVWTNQAEMTFWQLLKNKAKKILKD